MKYCLKTLLVGVAIAANAPAQGFWDFFGEDSIFEDAALWKMHGELEASYSFSDWAPAEIQGTTIETTGVNIATVQLDLRSGLYDRLLLPKLPSFRYDWTPGGDNDLQTGLQEALVSAREDDSFTRFLANTALIGGFLGEDDGLFGTLDVDYEVFAFQSSVELQEAKTYHSFEGDPRELAAGDEITSITLFEKWRLAGNLLFMIEDENTEQSTDFGPFFLTYQKPYAVTIEGEQDSSRILDSRFEAVGLGTNYRLRQRLSGEDGHGIFFDGVLGVDFGPAEVSFPGDASLGQMLPVNETVLFMGLNLDAALSRIGRNGLSWSIGAGARYFNFQATEGGVSYATVGDVDVNEDFVWFLNVGISYVF